jgi:hypothetical protein
MKEIAVSSQTQGCNPQKYSDSITEAVFMLASTQAQKRDLALAPKRHVHQKVLLLPLLPSC